MKIIISIITFFFQIEGKLNYLVSARPTAVNIKLAADELINLANSLCADDTVSHEEFKERFDFIYIILFFFIHFFDVFFYFLL